MRRAPYIIAVLVAGLTFPVARAARADDLAARIDKILADPIVSASHCGLRVWDVTGRRELYSRNDQELFSPASNMKLLTTAAAIDRLGADFAFVTLFATRGDDLLVLASGDPGMGDPRLAKEAGQPVERVFIELAERLKKQGVARIKGDLVVDDTVFDREFFHPHWPREQAGEWYEAEVGGFNFNDNCIDIRLAPSASGDGVDVELTPNTGYVQVTNTAVRDAKQHLVWFRRQGVSNRFVAGGKVKARMWTPESLPIHDPPAFAAQVLADTLARNGVAIDGRIRFQRLRGDDGRPPRDAQIVMRHEQLLGPCLWRCNTFSQNFIAESLFKALGAYESGSPNPRGQGSWASGRAAVLASLKRGGLAIPQGLVIDDGSGLSKQNRVSPRLICELLDHMARDEAAELWFDSLATGGVDGTLRKRFRDLDGKAEVLAKTGTLSDAAALSGYVKTADKRMLAFSILFDQVRPGNTWRAKRVMDQVVAVLADSGKGAK
ncbi:MAG: D-alanyl-D-alanine carboxypeptidase [Phycisphaerae bacterium]|nr:D-alanyl-D-alanine carboxypeptidase [Phycisphaerae bacterium]